MKKIIASILAVFFVLLSPFSAFASTTESMMMYASTRSIPTNYDITMNTIHSVNGNIYSGNSVVISDNSTSTFDSYSSYTGSISDLAYGVKFSFHPYIFGTLVSSRSFSGQLDLGMFSFGFNNNDLAFVLSPFANVSNAYITYNGRFDFKIYDGSLSGSGGDRFVYDKSFTITKPLDVSLSNFYQEYYKNYGSYNFNIPNGCDMSLSFDMLTVDDLLNVQEYRNYIYDYYTLVKDTETDVVSFEDFVLDVINIYFDSAEAIVLWDVSNANFVPYWGNDVQLSPVIDTGYYHCYIAPTPFHGDTTFVNVISHLNGYDTNSSFASSISNGFFAMTKSLGSSLSNVVTNATDNANRIIQNTTQKVDEVKQGVTEVKDSVIETKNSILDLPNKIKDMLLGLIVPSSETMSDKFSEFSELLEEKLGIIYQVPMMLFDFFDTIVNAATTPQTTLTLPAFQLPWIDGSTLTVWQPMEYKIIPEGMQVLSDLIKTITSMTVVVLTFNSVKRAYERFLRS